MNKLEEVKKAFEEKRFDDALSTVRYYIANGGNRDSDAWFWLGKILWKLDLRNEAISAYRTSAIIAPDGPGKVALDYAENIADFFNPDLYNP